MKKFLFIYLLFSTFVYSQVEDKYDSKKTDLPYWVQEMYSETPDPGKIELLYNNYYKENKFIKNKHTQYYKRWKRSLSREINTEKNSITPRKIMNLNLPEWECVGPFDFDRNAASTSYAAGAAHLYTVEQSISNSNILYAGGATCGLWKSLNKGLQWIPLFETELMINTVYSLEIDFTNPDIVYFSADDNLYRTINGGNSYELLYEMSFIKDIVMHPNNTNILFICSEERLYQLNISDNNLETLVFGDVLELEFHPTNSSIIYIVRQIGNKTEFLKSINSGETFDIYDSGWPSPNSNDEQLRTEIAVTLDNPNRVVALATGSANGGSGLYGIYVSDDQGENWEFRCCGVQAGGVPSETNMNLMGWSHEGLDDGGQYYYDLALAINPNNADNIHVGGVNHWVSNDGGYTFTCPSKWSWAADSENTKYVHADIHDIKYYNDDLWIACDGGIFYSNNLGDTIHQRMFGIAGTDFWGFGSGFSDGDVMIGGTYHNATLLKDNDTYIQGDTLEGTNELGGWVSVCGGDNYRGFVNFGDNRKVYLDEWGSGGGYKLSGDRTIPLEGFSMSVLSNASYTTGESSNLEFDPRCFNIIYIGNNDILYKSFDNGYSSIPIYDFSEKVTSIEVGWDNPDIIYVATYDGYWSEKNVWRSEDAGQTFVNITPTFPGVVADDWIPFDITVSSENANHVWIARCPNSLSYSSYDGSKVYKSTNGGENWTNITGVGLSGENITNIEYLRGSNDGIYLGTRKNVYYKNDTMTEWILYNNKLPLSTYSTQLVPYYKEQKLKNGTNRSVWEVDFYESPTPSAQIAADKLTINCMNDTVQFVNHSAMSTDNASWSWSFPGGNPSSSTEENPLIIYSNEGLYDVSLTINDISGSDNQTILGMINYTNNPLTMGGFDCDGTCQEGFMNTVLILEDSYGDGWNGNSLSIMVDDILLTQQTLSNGYYDEINLCIPIDINTCVEIIVQEGGWPEEVSWSIVNENENEVLSGGSPFYNQLYENCPIYGCTNSDAINYDPDANNDDGSCCFGEFYTIVMEDSYGDGWNGNTLVVGNYELELEEGSNEEEIICLEGDLSCFNVVCDGGDWQYEVSWIIYNPQGNIVLSGGAPYDGCFLEGCTDPIACNFNIEATFDNGNCLYPDENGDCENIILNEYNINTNFYTISDLLGRNINQSESQYIYIQNNNGKITKNVIFK
ncbi:MAG: hypothetical protein CMD26_04705 [Flavobacteriales bacterium]|mgnify:CR=1 FL=1|nr:hypothetical protein [Flavobacteriales bacterium]|tara:strand:+ start:874 stop:4443 length:3570 start_codon:yes stop_codon:yes gene_type:complete